VATRSTAWQQQAAAGERGGGRWGFTKDRKKVVLCQYQESIVRGVLAAAAGVQLQGSHGKLRSRSLSICGGTSGIDEKAALQPRPFAREEARVRAGAVKQRSQRSSGAARTRSARATGKKKKTICQRGQTEKHKPEICHIISWTLGQGYYTRKTIVQRGTSF